MADLTKVEVFREAQEKIKPITNEVEARKKKLVENASVIISFSVIALSIILYAFNTGYCKVFNLPTEVLSLDMTRLLPLAFQILSIATFILLLVAVLVYIFAEAVILRKIGFFGGGVLLLVSVVSNICAFYTHSIAVNKSYAIVTIPSATLSTSPRVPKDKSEEAFMLSEGTKVEIVDSVQGAVDGEVIMWLDVKADDQHRAWIRSTDVEHI